ncbi:MAG: hypothetical protein CPDRYMAC_0811 [uncultured Paraburkholderia sp.]|nr:MAG: hypothetical protein CPDRYDRY_0804 [uncultured Paraburkholderia sp.]CAH2914020.1 MAG: hypothetical protein CPDRYMAC_0811 [uncultured Paraburkholderia sp.]
MRALQYGAFAAKRFSVRLQHLFHLLQKTIVYPVIAVKASCDKLRRQFVCYLHYPFCDMLPRCKV